MILGLFFVKNNGFKSLKIGIRAVKLDKKILAPVDFKSLVASIHVVFSSSVILC